MAACFFLLAETQPVAVLQITISIDKDGDTSVDGNSMQLTELQSRLQRMSAGSNGQLSVVIQVDDQCPFEHVAVILSLCEEAGIENPRLESSIE